MKADPWSQEIAKVAAERRRDWTPSSSDDSDGDQSKARCSKYGLTRALKEETVLHMECNAESVKKKKQGKKQQKKQKNT